jgi:hypothetical protein
VYRARTPSVLVNLDDENANHYICRSESSVSFRRPAELGLSRDKVTDARRGPPGDCLDVMRQTIMTVGGMKAGHSQQMFEYMVGEIAAAQLLVTYAFAIKRGPSRPQRCHVAKPRRFAT